MFKNENGFFKLYLKILSLISNYKTKISSIVSANLVFFVEPFIDIKTQLFFVEVTSIFHFNFLTWFLTTMMKSNWREKSNQALAISDNRFWSYPTTKMSLILNEGKAKDSKSTSNISAYHTLCKKTSLRREVNLIVWFCTTFYFLFSIRKSIKFNSWLNF